MSGYHLYPVLAGADLRDRAARPQPADRLQRPDLARPRRVLRDRRLWRGDPDRQVRLALLGGDSDRRRGLLRRRLPVRLPGACASAASIWRWRPSRSRSRRRRSSTYKGFDAWTGGSQGLQSPKPGAAVRPAADHRPMAYSGSASPSPSCCSWSPAISCAAASAARMVAIRDHPIAAETMGVDAALYKTDLLRRSARSTPASRAASPRSRSASSRPTVSALRCRSPSSSASSSAASPRSAASLFGALFIEFVPNYADQLTVLFGESAKALPGAIYGVLMI